MSTQEQVKPMEEATVPEAQAEQQPEQNEAASEHEEHKHEATEVVEEAALFQKSIDEFYAKDHVEKPLEDSKISRRNLAFFGVMGQYSYKRCNVNFLEDDVIIFITGNKYQTYNLTTKEMKTYHSMDTDGVGSITVHQTRKYFAVAEKGVFPNIYVFEWPSLRLYRIMRKGTEQIYAHCEFSPSGTKLVSLGGQPDFTLTVWDWVNERVVLKCKAFGQEVFKSSFSPFSDDILFTGGSGHIKFWKMAKTFTGLKLQGEIAKYGQLELSDVRGFHELPDGKVLSGTEYGTMILWEGNLVKAHLVLDRETKKPLHSGGIEVILFEDDFFITGGTDGYIKWWPLKDIDEAEADEIAEVTICPTKEVSILTEEGDHAHIISMIKGNGFWLVSDAKGRLWKLNCHDFTAFLILDYHSGAITDLAMSDAFNLAVTCAEDGTVKVWDYCRKKAIYSKQFIGKALSIDLMRKSELNKGRLAVVGFETGIVRILQITDQSIDLALSFKAHDAQVKFVRYAPSQTMLVTACKTGSIFFFDVNGHLELGKYIPICQVQLPDQTEINDLKWDKDSNKILVCCQNGYAYEINKPNIGSVDTKDSYLIADYPIRSFKIKMMEFQMQKNQKKDPEEEEKKRRMRLRGELKDEAEEVEEDWDPEPLSRICYMNDDSGNFLVGCQGLFKGFLYLCSFNQERPIKAIPMNRDIPLTFMSFSAFNDVLIQGWANGEVRICVIANPDRCLIIKQHDAVTGKISSVKFNFDERMMISAGYDGMMFSHVIDKYMIMQEAAFVPLAGVEGVDYMPDEQVKEITQKKISAFQKENEPNLPEIDPTIDGLDESLFAVTLRGLPEHPKDIIDTSQYSIQQAKLRTEEDHRLKMAELKKEGVRHKISELRKEFKKLTADNVKEDPAIRVQDEDFNIDPEYFIMLADQNLAKSSETNKEVAWEKERQRLRLDKLTQKFFDVLDFEKFTVKAMRTPAYVTTFRVPKMSEFLNRNFEQFKSLMEKEITSKENMDFDDEENHAENAQDAAVVNVSKKVTAVASNQHKSEAEKKREERKIEREKRKKKIEKYLKKEHSQQGDNAAHLEEIKQARSTFGTFNLKMSHDYEVPESLQINNTKKRQQMVLLEGSIHKLKVDFNSKINELKSRKKLIIGKVAVLHQRLNEINTELGTPEELILPKIDEKLENPNQLYNVNEKDIEDYKALKLQKEMDAAQAKKGGKKGKKGEEEKKEVKDDEEKEVKDEEKKDERNTHENPYFNVVAERKNRKAMESELDDEYKQILKIERTYEKEQLKNEVDTLINDFDHEIKEMQKEKYRLESDLKNADIKLILLFEELILLKSMEDKDQELSAQLKECRDQKVEIMRNVGDIKKKLAQKQIDINVIKQHQDDLDAKFQEFCHTGSNKYAILRAFYEKIVRKKKKVEKVEKGDAENDDEEEGEAEEEEEPEEEEDDDEDNAIAGLPQEEYKTDEIEKLREERMELVAEKDKISDFINMLENERSRADKMEKRINETLLETEESIADFQKEKMAKLNQLSVQVVLKIKQIQNLVSDSDRITYWCQVRQNQYEELLADIAEKYEDEEERKQASKDIKEKMLSEQDWRGWFLPENLDRAVLFTKEQLDGLLERKKQLDEEKAKLKLLKNEKDAIKKRDEKTIKEKNKIRDIKKREYEERQLLRFGSLIELDTLEVSGPSAIVQELINKFKKKEVECIKKIEDTEADHEKTQRELTACVQKNTSLLDLIRQLGEEQLDLNQKLEDTNKQIFQQSDNPKQRQLQALKKEYEERIRVNKIQILEKQQEINLYKKKGGHIYTKVTTNRKMQHLQDQ